MNNWGIEINKKKTQFLATGGRKQMDKLSESGIEIGNEVIKGDKSIKYLGIHINQSKNSKGVINHAIKQGKCSFRKIRMAAKEERTCDKSKGDGIQTTSQTDNDV